MTRIEEIEERAGRDFIYDPFNYRDDVLYLLAENKRMREALVDIARQKLSSEMDTDAWTSADWTGGYDSCVETARAHLNAALKAKE